MGIYSLVFGKKNHIEKWTNTPQEMKEKLVVATIQGRFSARRMGSIRSPAVIDHEIDSFLALAKEHGFIKQITEEITDGYRRHNINEPSGRVMRRFVGLYLKSLEQAQKEGKKTGLPHF